MTDAELAAFLSAREGKLTASNMAAAMSFLKSGKPSSERTALQKAILAERLTGCSVPHYVSPEMKWGTENEPHAKAAYEVETGELIVPCVTIDHPSIDLCAATPDGLVGADGLVETKCPRTETHITWLLAGVVPEQHKPQMILQAACTGRRWIDFVSFDPRLPEKQQLFIRRFEPTAEEIGEVEAAAIVFLDEVQTMFDQLTTATNPQGEPA